MSNQVVGAVYAQIIDRIIVEAQNDFEEAGLEQETLQELKQKWQSNISAMHITHCPWDPSPPPQQVANPPTLPSNVKTEGYKPEAYKGEYKRQQEYNPEVNGSSSHQQQPRNGARPEPQMKQEIKYERQMPPAYQHQGSLNPLHAQQRSQQLLQQQFGSQANASIQAMQHQQQQRQGVALPHQQHQHHQQHHHQQQHHQQQYQHQYQQRPNHTQLPGQAPSQPPQQSHAQQPSSLGAAQTDGAGDAQSEWTSMLAERRGCADEDRLAADDTLKAYLEQSATESHNGIMMPLCQHPSMRHSRRKTTASSQPRLPAIAGPCSADRPVAQFDGGDDDEDSKPKIEADEDAINSDLDDSEDELENPDADDQEGGNVGETILCTYDKVQRVKNKWKCVLKDGILTTSGKEYVFHKATGEFEW